MDANRGTGRTTRMKDEAVLAAARGETVLIVAHTRDYAKHIANDVAERTGERVSFCGLIDLDASLRGRGELSVYVDHHALAVSTAEQHQVLLQCGFRTAD
jgi:hypothetical protein